MVFYNQCFPRFDLSAMVEIFKNFGKQRHTIQFRGWYLLTLATWSTTNGGVAYVTNTTSPLAYSRVDANGVPFFRMNVVNNSLTYETYRKGTAIADVWQGQLGIRYIF